MRAVAGAAVAGRKWARWPERPGQETRGSRSSGGRRWRRWLEAGAGRGRPERGRSGDGGGGKAGAATVVAGRASPETRAKKTMRERLLDLGAVPLC